MIKFCPIVIDPEFARQLHHHVSRGDDTRSQPVEERRQSIQMEDPQSRRGPAVAIQSHFGRPIRSDLRWASAHGDSHIRRYVGAQIMNHWLDHFDETPAFRTEIVFFTFEHFTVLVVADVALESLVTQQFIPCWSRSILGIPGSSRYRTCGDPICYLYQCGFGYTPQWTPKQEAESATYTFRKSGKWETSFSITLTILVVMVETLT